MKQVHEIAVMIGPLGFIKHITLSGSPYRHRAFALSITSMNHLFSFRDNKTIAYVLLYVLQSGEMNKKNIFQFHLWYFFSVSL